MMKKYLCILVLVALAVSCKEKEVKSPLQKKVDEYALVTLSSPLISDISENGKEVLNLYRFAAKEIDKMYWDQYFGDPATLGELPAAEKSFAYINYGPWDRADGKAFLPGYGARPAGANFYPADMTEEEWNAFDDPAKTSPYTLVRRDESGALKTVPFHEAYAANIEKIGSCLKAAADLTIVPSVREYLLAKADALATDEYYAADKAWFEMDNSKMDLVIGPNREVDDQLHGIKKSYEAYVLLKDVKRTEQLEALTSKLPELQAALPCDEAYKSFVPGSSSNIFACDALYYAGVANAGIKVIALNRPSDPEVQAEFGTRTMLLRNVMSEKFNRIFVPTGGVLLSSDQVSHLSDEAFFWNIAFREVAHGLGVKETVNGKGSVTDALGEYALFFEEMKGNIVGLYLAENLVRDHKLTGIVTPDDCLTTFMVSLARSERFGEGTALGRANIAMFNYLQEQGAFSRAASGKYTIDYGRMSSAVKEFCGLILKTQAEGDKEFAASFEKKYAAPSANYKADLTAIRLENIPRDLRFEFE